MRGSSDRDFGPSGLPKKMLQTGGLFPPNLAAEHLVLTID